MYLMHQAWGGMTTNKRNNDVTLDTVLAHTPCLPISIAIINQLLFTANKTTLYNTLPCWDAVNGFQRRRGRNVVSSGGAAGS